jgi:glycosyltransferase involved in cell wall biosynthesis
MTIALILFLLCLCGFILFRRITLNRNDAARGEVRVSVIIPARNEAKNLPVLLSSLMQQTQKPYEIIVCDDHSQDATGEIARGFGVTLIDSPPLPENWTGKNWAVWNGFLKSSGDVLVFLDADVELGERALEILVGAREKAGGAISVVPYHKTVKFFEKFSLLLYLLGVFVFTSPFEKNNRNKGLYGSCIVAHRKDYETISGHSNIRSELLDDLNLGKRFLNAGINVTNFIGRGVVSFRMYQSLKDEVNGFGKGALLSTSNLKPATMLFVVLWIVGLLASGFCAPVFLLLRHPWAMPFLAGYLMYTLQLLYFQKQTGKYGLLMPVLHVISSAFFLYVILYSAYRVVVKGSVVWKGREIQVGKKK